LDDQERIERAATAWEGKMKALSSAIVILFGAAMMIFSSSNFAHWNRDALCNIGVLICLAGVAGWGYCLVKDK
jgi:hypothetical protein